MRTRAKLKNVATIIQKESLLLTHYSHFLPALKEAKNVARIFSTYFENNRLKNEARKLAKNVTTGCNLF